MQGFTLSPTELSSLSSNGSRPKLICRVGLPIVVSIPLSFAYACAIPFAALSTFAALKFRRREALLSLGAVWLINQAVGYGCLNYPRTPESFAWGVALGVATYAALIVAMRIARRLQKTDGLLKTLMTFAVAFATFKAFLFGMSFAIPGGNIAFSWPVFKKIAVINAATFLALLVFNYLLNWLSQPTSHWATDERSRAWYEQNRDRVVTL